MTEDEARAWIAARFDVDAIDRVGALADAVVAGSEHQNLIAPSTLPHIWARHIVDSLQLVTLAPPMGGTWFDIGTGAGFPGLAIALATQWRVTLVEPRRLRADFLRRVIDECGVGDRVKVFQGKAGGLREGAASVISARAVAPVETILADTAAIATSTTRYILPKGEGAESAMAQACTTWHGKFHVERSIVDPASGIVVARGVRRR